MCLIVIPLLDLFLGNPIVPNVCHHCGVSGHTCPNCFKLYPYKRVSKRSQVSSHGCTPLLRELLKALSFLTQFKGMQFPLCPPLDVLGPISSL